LTCRPAEPISAEALYPAGGFAEFRDALAKNSKAVAAGNRAAPTWVNTVGASIGPDMANSTYMQYTFLKTGDCVSYNSAYLDSYSSNMCYGALGVASAALTATVDDVDIRRVARWDADITMVVRGTLFGTDVDILSYAATAGAGES
jgi:hypothetical protein